MKDIIEKIDDLKGEFTQTFKGYKYFELNTIEALVQLYQEDGNREYLERSIEHMDELKTLGRRCLLDMYQAETAKKNGDPAAKIILSEAAENAYAIDAFGKKYQVDPDLFKDGTLTVSPKTIFNDQEQDLTRAIASVDPRRVADRLEAEYGIRPTTAPKVERWSKAPSKQPQPTQQDTSRRRFSRYGM